MAIMDPVAVALVVVGLPILLVGAELLVRGASRLARAAGISPVVVGLTVVAFGTSAPELAVNVTAVWGGSPDVAIGNVVGSNIANILLILAIAAIVAPLAVAARIVRADVPLMIGTAALLWLYASDGELTRLEGLILLGGLVLYLLLLWWESRREPAAIEAEFEAGLARPQRTPAGIVRDVAFVAGGLVALVLGGRAIVDGAVGIATGLGLPEVVVGLTVVAVGTSLPELATAVIAGLRGEPDLAVGNVVGSCIFNVLAVVGLTATVAPDGVPVPPSVLSFDLPVMVAVTVIALPIVLTGFVIRRWEGALLLAYYAAYLAYVVLDATGRPTEAFSEVMLTFVIPATALGLGLAAWVELRRIRPGPAAPSGQAGPGGADPPGS
jgi:cation:H+ antiporter